MAPERAGQRAGRGRVGGDSAHQYRRPRGRQLRAFCAAPPACARRAAGRPNCSCAASMTGGSRTIKTGFFPICKSSPWPRAGDVKVPRRPGQKARVATLAIRFTQVRFAPPAHQFKYRGQSEEITLWAISAQEENPAPGREAICWRLWSTQPVGDAAGAITAVRPYRQRWQIELFHKILKNGCRVEERPFENAERIERCLWRDIIVAPFDFRSGQPRAHPGPEPRRARRLRSDPRQRLAGRARMESALVPYPPQRDAARPAARYGRSGARDRAAGRLPGPQARRRTGHDRALARPAAPPRHRPSLANLHPNPQRCG